MLTFIDRLSNIKRTLVIAVLLLLGLSSLGFSVARIHATGTAVVLATAPVDPRSLFQGDYVVLSYPIGWLEYTRFPETQHEELLTHGQDVYVELQPGEPVWTPVRYSLHPLEAAHGHVVIKGDAENPSLVTLKDANSLRVRYGIESFLVPEGQGLPIERLRNASDRVTVKVMVAPDGKALPLNILIDGKPVFADAGL